MKSPDFIRDYTTISAFLPSIRKLCCECESPPKCGESSHRNLMAEKEGFEPSRPVTDLRAFQARPFSLLGISPATQNIITKMFSKNI